MVSDEMRKRTTAEWAELLREADIPVFPMHTFESLMDDQHLRDIGFFGEADHPVAGRIRTMAVPSEWSGTVPRHVGLAPELGEHSAEILAEVGYAADAIARMMEAGVTKAPARKSTTN
jgi:crotonobetainyl-CoA:carnitine CoA-transferase CaiB-like acyl-CoA transferase